MARIRTVKPDLFRSRSLAKVTVEARLTFIGLWTEADDHGRGVADPRLLKGSLWPLDDNITPSDVSSYLEELDATGHIIIYTVDDDRFYEVKSWSKHQSAAYRRGESVHPAPPIAPPPKVTHDQSCKEMRDAQTIVLEGKGREGKGRELLAETSQEDSPSTDLEQTDASATPTKGERARDPIFDALVTAVGWTYTEMTATQRRTTGVAVAELRTVGATPDEIRQRAIAYRRKYPTAALTPSALKSQWAALSVTAREPVRQMSKSTEALMRVAARHLNGQEQP